MKSLTILILIAYCVAAILTTNVAVAQTTSKLRPENLDQTHGTGELPANGAQIEEVVVESSLFIKPKSNPKVRRVRSVLPAEFLNALIEHKRVKRQGFGGNRGFGGGFGGPGGGFGGGFGGPGGGFGGPREGFGGPREGFGGPNGAAFGRPSFSNSNSGFNSIRPGLNGDTVQSGTHSGSDVNGGGSAAGTNVSAGPDGANANVDAEFHRLPNSGNGQSQAASNAAANNNYNNPEGFGSSSAIAQGQAFESQGDTGGFGASSASTGTQNLAFNQGGLSNSAGASLSQTYKLPNGQTINFASTNSFANGPFGNNANSRGGAVSVSG